jgi:hypothetical protein
VSDFGDRGHTMRIQRSAESERVCAMTWRSDGGAGALRLDADIRTSSSA